MSITKFVLSKEKINSLTEDELYLKILHSETIVMNEDDVSETFSLCTEAGIDRDSARDAARTLKIQFDV